MWNEFDKIHKLLNGKVYLLNMTIYHILAIILFMKGIHGFTLHTLVGIDESLIAKSSSIVDIVLSGKGLISTLMIITIIIGIDFVFLIILSYDFTQLNLTWTKIYSIEAIIFIIALFIPTFRALLLFFSLNTIQIFIFYHLAIMFDAYRFYLIRYVIVIGSFIMLGNILYFSIPKLI